jgi:hypothetical protein
MTSLTSQATLWRPVSWVGWRLVCAWQQVQRLCQMLTVQRQVEVFVQS